MSSQFQYRPGDRVRNRATGARAMVLVTGWDLWGRVYRLAADTSVHDIDYPAEDIEQYWEPEQAIP